MKNFSKKGCAILLAAMLLLGAFSFAGFSEDAVSDLPSDVCTAIVGTDLTFAVRADAVSAVSSRTNNAAVACGAGELTVLPAATGDTTITVSYADGSAEAFDLYVYASQEEYDYLKTVFQGKVFSVLGDSISTLEPWDDGGASRYYDVDLADNCGPDSGLVDENGMNNGGIPIRRRDTYWGNLQTRFDMTLGNLVSWKGKSVVGWMENDAQISRLGKHGTPDVILFYGGSNDIRLSKEINTFRTAYDNVLCKLKANYPNAKILALLPCAPSAYAPYNAAVSEVCAAHAVEFVNLANSGVAVLHPDADGFSKEVGYILDTLYANHLNNSAQSETPEEPDTSAQPTTRPTTQPQQQGGGCKYCGGTHTGFPGVLIGFFHSILALFGLKKK